MATHRILWHISLTFRAISWRLCSRRRCQSCWIVSEWACVVCHNNMFTVVKENLLDLCRKRACIPNHTERLFLQGRNWKKIYFWCVRECCSSATMCSSFTLLQTIPSGSCSTITPCQLSIGSSAAAFEGSVTKQYDEGYSKVRVTHCWSQPNREQEVLEQQLSHSLSSFGLISGLPTGSVLYWKIICVIDQLTKKRQKKSWVKVESVQSVGQSHKRGSSTDNIPTILT